MKEDACPKCGANKKHLSITPMQEDWGRAPMREEGRAWSGISCSVCGFEGVRVYKLEFIGLFDLFGNSVEEGEKER